MYFSHSTTKVDKLSGSKGFVENWKLPSSLNIKIEKVTNVGGTDTIQANKFADRFLYVIDGSGSIVLMDNELRLEKDSLFKIPRSKQLDFGHSQVKYLLVTGENCEEINIKSKHVIDATEDMVLYFLNGDGNIQQNNKSYKLKENVLLTLAKGESVQLNGSSKVLKITPKQ